MRSDGVKTAPQNLLNAATSFGASEWQIFRSVVFPSTAVHSHRIEAWSGQSTGRCSGGRVIRRHRRNRLYDHRGGRNFSDRQGFRRHPDFCRFRGDLAPYWIGWSGALISGGQIVFLEFSVECILNLHPPKTGYSVIGYTIEFILRKKMSRQSFAGRITARGVGLEGKPQGFIRGF
jgi:hypothetical protein